MMAKVLGVVVSLFLVFVAAMMGIWVADRDAPTVVLKAIPENPVVAPGGILRVRFEVQRSKSCAVKTERLLYDAHQTRFPLEDVDFQGAAVLGYESYVSAIKIPSIMAEGPARYIALNTFVCNIVHKWFWPIITDGIHVSFTVQGPAVLDRLPMEVTPLK